MYQLKQSAVLDVLFFAFDANGDGVTGKVDADFTKRISKNGGVFAAMTVTITERENGFYHCQISGAHSDTLGILTISLSSSGIKRVNLQYRVHAKLPDDLSTQASLDAVDDFVDTEIANIQSRLPATLTAGGNIRSDALVVSDKVGYSLSVAGIQAIWDALTSALTTIGSVGKLLVDNINAAISSRASQSSVDLIDDFIDTEIAAIKVKTDALPTDPADASDIAASFAGVNVKLDTIDDFVDTEVAAIKAKTDQLNFTGATVNANATIALAPTDLNAIADALLKRDMSAVTGEASRSPLNALRFLRNKFSIAGSTLTVTKEDDATPAWTSVLTTDAAAVPITGSDPA